MLFERVASRTQRPLALLVFWGGQGKSSNNAAAQGRRKGNVSSRSVVGLLCFNNLWGYTVEPLPRPK